MSIIKRLKIQRANLKRLLTRFNKDLDEVLSAQDYLEVSERTNDLQDSLIKFSEIHNEIILQEDDESNETYRDEFKELYYSTIQKAHKFLTENIHITTPTTKYVKSEKGSIGESVSNMNNQQSFHNKKLQELTTLNQETNLDSSMKMNSIDKDSNVNKVDFKTLNHISPSTEGENYEDKHKTTKGILNLERIKFHNKHIEHISKTKDVSKQIINHNHQNIINTKRILSTTQGFSHCNYCQGIHKIYYCQKFLELSTSERIKSVKTKKLCLNCLRRNHRTRECILGHCKKCNKKHNTLLHIVPVKNTTVNCPLSVIHMQPDHTNQIVLNSVGQEKYTYPKTQSASTQEQSIYQTQSKSKQEQNINSGVQSTFNRIQYTHLDAKKELQMKTRNSYELKQTEHDDLHKENVKLQKQVELQKVELNSYIHEIKKRDKELAEMNVKLEEAKHEIKLKDEFEQHKIDVNKKLANAETELVAKHAIIESYALELAQLQKELLKANFQIQFATTREPCIQQMDMKILQVNAQVEAKCNEMAHCHDVNTKQIQELTRKLEESHRAIAELEQRLTTSMSNVQTINEKLNKHEYDKLNSHPKIQCLQLQLDWAHKVAQQQQRKNKQIVSQLKAQLKTFKQHENRSVKKDKQHQVELLKLTTELDSAITKIKTLKEKLGQQKEKNKNIRKVNLKLMKESSAAERANENTKNVLHKNILQAIFGSQENRKKILQQIFPHIQSKGTTYAQFLKKYERVARKFTSKYKTDSQNKVPIQQISINFNKNIMVKDLEVSKQLDNYERELLQECQNNNGKYAIDANEESTQLQKKANRYKTIVNDKQTQTMNKLEMSVAKNERDLLTGNDGDGKTMEFRDNIRNLLYSEDFILHQQTSNDSRLLSMSKDLDLYKDSPQNTKTLGNHWNSQYVTLSYSIQIQFENGKGKTKRSILSKIAKCPDSLGLPVPVLFQANL